MQSGNLTPMSQQAPQLQSNPNIQAAKNMMNLVRNSKNPQAMIQNLAMQNPNLREAMNLIQQSGGNMQEAFMNLARQRGVDPNAFLQAFQ